MLSMFNFILAQCLMIMSLCNITCHCRFNRQTPRLVFTELTQEVARQLEHQLAACSGEEQLQQLVGVAWISRLAFGFCCVFFFGGPGDSGEFFFFNASKVWRKMCQAFKDISKIYSFLDAAFVRRLENDVPGPRSSWRVTVDSMLPNPG